MIGEEELKQTCPMKMSSENNNLVIGLMGLAVATLILKFGYHKHLSMDGVGYFVHILENGSITGINVARRSSELLVQLPLVVAVRLGVKSIPVLVQFFALGILLPYLISFVFSWYALSEREKTLMLFPLASYFSISMTGDYLLSGEHHVMTLMVWPVLFLLLIERPLRAIEGVLLLVSLVIFCWSYETAVIPIGLFLLIIGVRLWRFRIWSEWIVLGGAASVLSMGLITGIELIRVPRSLVQKGSFIDALSRNLKIKEVLFFVPFMGAVFVGWLIDNRFRNLKIGIYLIGLGILLGYGFVRVSSDYSITSYWSFSSRTLTVLLLPVLLVGALIVKICKPYLTRLGISVFATGCVLLTAFNISDLRNWSSLKSEMESVLHETNSAVLIPIEETGIDDSELRHVRSSWNNPALSLVWSYPCVKHLITNGTDFGGYQVFNPENEIRLRGYLEFAEGFKDIDPGVNVCE